MKFPSKLKYTAAIVIVLFWQIACKETDDISYKSPVSFTVPEGFPTPVYQFNNNAFTPMRFELGRTLFYDPILSVDNTISCGSCHQQFSAFAHLDHDVSHGVQNLSGKRNAPALFNLAWHPYFMHDGGVNSIELQPLAPITNPVEHAETISNVISKLNASTTYKQRFKICYGSDSITTALMLKALTQFMVALVSSSSKYDLVKSGKMQFTSSEQAGYLLFKQKCEQCHKEPLFSDFTFRNNGLDSVFADSGRAIISLNTTDIGKFKVPSLRNIMLTKPYMHDGRHKNIGQVINHYSNGIKNSNTIDPLLPVGGFSFTEIDKENLIAFLKTLTDTEFVSNQYFSEP